MSYLDSCSDNELFSKFFESFNFSLEDAKALSINDENFIIIKYIMQGAVDLSKVDTHSLFIIKEFILSIRGNDKFIKRADDDEDMFYASSKVLIDRIDNVVLERINSRKK